MTMHMQRKMDNYATAMAEVWEKWLLPKSSPGVSRRAMRKNARMTRVRNAIIAATRGFMRPPNIIFQPLEAGLCGSFSWGSWRLRINVDYFRDNTTYEDFLEMCITGYHETRHAEQFYRVAQGLAAGELTFPDRSGAGVINARTSKSGIGTVAARRALFEKASKSESIALTPEVLAEWLNIPNDVANHASTAAKERFNEFLRAEKPRWFRRRTTKLEVEEWMREVYKTTLGDVGNWAQGDDAGYEFYRDQPTEWDAHGIEDTVKEKIQDRIGVREAGHANARRNDPVFRSIGEDEPVDLSSLFA